MIMIDGSMAMWNSVLGAFCRENRIQYYERCWRVVTEKASLLDLQTTFVHNCLSHAMRAAKTTVMKYYKRHHKTVAMFWIALLFSCDTLAELDSTMESIIAVTNCETMSLYVQNHFNQLHQQIKQHKNIEELANISLKSSSVRDDYLFTSKAMDDKQELNSPFYLHFKQKLENYRQSDVFANHQLSQTPKDSVANENSYEGKEFCEKLIRIIISRISTTSQLMLGDLSRHHQKPLDNANDEIKTIYKQYQKKHKQLADSKLKTVCVNNLTQGTIEQYFSELKRVYLKGGRAVRLDDLVEKLYE